MSRWLNRLLLGLAVGLLLLTLGWVFNHIESYEQQQNTGLSARAKRNDFLAAEFFLQRSGIEAASVSGRELLYQLPTPDHAIVLADFNISLSQKRQQALRQWLEQGGQLLTTAPTFLADDDSNVLKSLFSIESVFHAQDKVNGNAKELAVMDVQFVDLEETVKVALDMRFSLRFDEKLYHQDDIAIVRTGDDIHLLQLSIGKGFLTVVSDLNFLKNTQIKQPDHAFFLWQLLGDSRKVWMLYSNHTPALWLRAWKYNAPLFVSVLVLGGFYFWSLWGRFGPIIQNPQIARRNILQHLRAVGQFHWKLDHAQQLIEQNRELLQQHIRTRHPGWRVMNQHERMDWLAQRLGVEAGALEQAFYSRVQNDEELVRIARLLQITKLST
jgi:hypothetical protein